MVPPEVAVAARAPVTDLDGLAWDNRFTRSLPADPVETNARRQVHGAAYSRVRPTPVASPTTLAWSPEVADLLGIDHAVCETADFAAVFGGNRVPPGADPFAMCYGGHQFGNWAGQLGDGRAIALGEIVAPDGAHQTLQLKGAGPTPYSRNADGRAVLRSSLREFLCSEAMHHLGVPTTRALSLVGTGDEVWRDMLYDGHPAAEPGAVVCRVAPSFVRFGNFQLPPSRGDHDLLRALVDHTLAADFPHLTTAVAGSAAPAPGDEAIAALFDEVCDRTATLVVHWMRVGFVHGVLNTDNMSILGLTIDYGPYGWLENFDPGWTPNTTDASRRRYRYGAQPQVVHWNLAQLGSALVPIVSDPQPLQEALDRFADRYAERFTTMVNRRLGWGETAPAGGTPGAVLDGDSDLVGDMFSLLTSSEIDQVLFFRHLADVSVTDADERSDDDLLDPVRMAWYRPEELVADHATATAAWLRRWAARARAGGLTDTERRAVMRATNPRYVLRNYLAQEAIDAATEGDVSLTHELLDVLRRPYDDQPDRERFAAKRPEWARHRVGCSMLSCSS